MHPKRPRTTTIYNSHNAPNMAFESNSDTVVGRTKRVRLFISYINIVAHRHVLFMFMQWICPSSQQKLYVIAIQYSPLLLTERYKGDKIFSYPDLLFFYSFYKLFILSFIPLHRNIYYL